MNQRLALNKDSYDVEFLLGKDNIYSQGKILSSMNTEADPLALQVFQQNIQRNLGDPALFPGTVLIERNCINIMGKLFSLPESGTGAILSGGSEANITALWAIRNKMRSERKKTNFQILAPESVHVSVDKAADLLNIDLIKIPVTDKYQIDLRILQDSITDTTIAIVGVAGTTSLGTIDPLKELNDICLTNNLLLHIDAAFGGFVIPFLADSDKYSLSFTLPAISSMTVDLHKMGRIPINGGGLLWRDRSYPDAIKFVLPYLAGKPEQYTISGTRSGAAAIAFSVLWNKRGYSLFKENALQCVENTRFLAKELEERGFLIPVKPVINILGAIPPMSSFTTEELHTSLWEKGWTTSIVNGFLRLVIMPSTTKSNLKLFLKAIDDLIIR